MLTYTLNYLANFAVIFSSMALFFLPFVAVFSYRNRTSIIASKPHFNFFMERFFLSPESDALVFCWAAAEAVFWFIIPEFLLVLVMFMRLHRKFDLVKYDILGTVVGSIIAIYIQLPTKTFLQLPYIRPRMLTQVHIWFQHQGILGLLNQPFSGVPYKVFTHVAPDFHFFIPLFIILAIAARMIRYLVAYQVTKALYPAVHGFVRQHYLRLFIGAIAVFTFLLLHVVSIYS